MTNALTAPSGGSLSLEQFNEMLGGSAQDVLFESPYERPAIDSNYMRLIQAQSGRPSSAPDIPNGAYLVSRGEDNLWGMYLRVNVIDIIGGNRSPYDHNNPAPRKLFSFDPVTGQKADGGIMCMSADGVRPRPEYYKEITDYRDRVKFSINENTYCEHCELAKFKKVGDVTKGPPCEASPIFILYVFDWSTEDSPGMVVQYSVRSRAKQAFFGDKWYTERKIGQPLVYWTGKERTQLANGRLIDVPRWMTVDPHNPSSFVAYPIIMTAKEIRELGSFYLPQFGVFKDTTGMPEQLARMAAPLTEAELAGFLKAKKDYQDKNLRDVIRRVNTDTPQTQPAEQLQSGPINVQAPSLPAPAPAPEPALAPASAPTPVAGGFGSAPVPAPEPEVTGGFGSLTVADQPKGQETGVEDVLGEYVDGGVLPWDD